MLREFIELGRVRLERGWTYRQLAAEVNKVSPASISVSALHGLLNNPKLRPNDLTLHGVRQFLSRSQAVRERRGDR